MSEKMKIIINGDASSAKRALKDVGAATQDTMKVAAAAGAAFTAAFALIEGKIIGVSSEFERYRVQLDTIEGSSAKAAASMNWITDFTAKTPYELSQVTDAFVKLKAYGIDPVANDALKTLGDTAAAMGKPLNQAVEALADAATGEFERLKEFGIKAKVVGDTVQFNYSQNGQQMSASADKNSQAMIQATLEGIWNDKYSGGMDKLSQTWDGMVSNLGDNWTIFQKNVGDSGAFNAAKGSLSILLSEIENNDAGIKALATNISDGLVTGMQAGVTAAAMVAKGFSALSVVTDSTRVAIDSVALASVEAFDGALAGLQSFYDALASLPGALGEPYAQASLDIAAFRKDLAYMEDGIKATGGESMNTLVDGIANLGKEMDAIDQKAVKFISAMEMARDGSTTNVNQGDKNKAAHQSTGSNQSGGKPKVAKAMADAQKIIDINSYKFEQIRILAQAAFGDDEARTIAQNDADIVRIESERQRFLDATALQIEDKTQRREALANIDLYYDQLVADRAEQTASRLDAIHAKSSKGAVKWEDMTGKQKLGVAQQGLSQMAGLMNSHSRKAFEVGKAAAMANAVIDTYKAATGAYSSLASIPYVGPVLGAAAAAAAVMAGMANVKKIQSSKFGGGAGGAPSVPSSVTASAGAMGGGNIPSFQSQAQQQTNQQQPTQVSITVQALHPDAISPDTLQMMADGFAPALHDSFGRGQHLAVQAA